MAGSSDSQTTCIISIHDEKYDPFIPLEVSMLPIPFPILLADRQAYIVRAHRLRGAVVATLIRDLARWVSAAAR
jgi:hypothetical protein